MNRYTMLILFSLALAANGDVTLGGANRNTMLATPESVTNVVNAALTTLAGQVAETYQPLGAYLTEIPADVISGAAAGTTAVQLAALDAYLPINGTRAMSANLPMGGQSITNLFNIQMGGYWQALIGSGTSTIDPTARGASQSGYNGGTQTIGWEAYGASQIVYNNGTQAIGSAAYGASQSGSNDGTQTIGADAYGASQAGRNDGMRTIGFGSYGANQSGFNLGTQTIGASAFGASQSGRTFATASATNNAAGAMQLHRLTAGQHALTTSDGSASILLGAGTVSNKNSIVAGDGLASNGDGSITATSFWGDASGMSGISQVGKTGQYADLIGAPVLTDSYIPWTAILTSVNGTATVTRAHGIMPMLTLTAPCVITVDPADFGTDGVSRVNLSLWAGTNSVTLLTNNVAYSSTPTVSTNDWTSILYRRTGAGQFRGVGL